MNKPFDAPFAEPLPSPTRRSGGPSMTLTVSRQRYPAKDCPHPRAFVEKPAQEQEPSEIVFKLRINLAYIAFIWIVVYIVLFAYAVRSVN